MLILFGLFLHIHKKFLHSFPLPRLYIIHFSGTTNPILGKDKRLCRVYMDLIHPWEAGSPTSFQLPIEAGIPLGNDGYISFRVEVHYHNPRRLSGLVDRSGVRIYYTLEKRPNVAGLMLLGDYMLKLRGSYTVGGSTTNTNTTITDGARGMRHSLYCPSSCFSKRRLDGNTVNTTSNSSSNVTVFREVLHMHKSGQRMTNIHLNSAGNIQRVSEANRFDFSCGAGYASRVDLPYLINEGDSFVTTCYFTTQDVVWGSGSDEEMCQTFIWYYPIEDYTTLTCGYYDASASAATITQQQQNGSDSSSNLDSIGCEMSYDRAQVTTNLDRLQPNQQCQVSVNLKRAFHSFDSLVDLANLQSWPSLFKLVNTWKKSMTARDDEQATAALNNATTNSSYVGAAAQDISSPSTAINVPNEKCQGLCPNGLRPTKPGVIVNGFSWTCDELDAAIPVLYTHPSLLYFNRYDIPPCEKYYESFGEICGCPTDEESIISTILSSKATQLIKDGSVGATTGVLLLFVLIIILFYKRMRAS